MTHPLLICQTVLRARPIRHCRHRRTFAFHAATHRSGATDHAPVALTSQQNAEVWACVKHDLGLKGDSPLLACHFSAAEASLNQRLAAAQDNHHHRQTLAQLSDLLGQGNNRRGERLYSSALWANGAACP